ncbi:MAG: DinB family protein [Chloroflexia bacterium]
MNSVTSLNDTELTTHDLRELTNQMVDRMLKLIESCSDAEVTQEPEDPEANDPTAATEAELNMPWTLGHVIVHTTASAEEAAALAAELGRGVEHHGRSRSEVPWRTVTAIQQCRERLEESRRMRLASLDMWPDQPYLDNTYTPREGVPPINCVRRFLNGLKHDESHLGQIERLTSKGK